MTAYLDVTETPGPNFCFARCNECKQRSDDCNPVQAESWMDDHNDRFHKENK